MNRSDAVIDLRVAVSRDEAVRYLGYPQGRAASQRAALRLDALWSVALALLAPRGALRLVDRSRAAAVGMPDPGETVAVAVCTIGPAVEEEEARLAAAGELLDALVLDAIGSAAAEAAADALNLEICALARERGLGAAPRVSPGYGSWATACQPALLELLPIEDLGIALTSGAMMTPRKSVSFAVALAVDGAEDEPGGSRCARCGLADCRHRRARLECG